MRGRPWRRSATAFAVTAVVVFTAGTLAPAAGAVYDPVASGAATLKLDGSFTAVLKRAGVELKCRRGCRVSGRTVALPVADGEADPTIRKADLELGGELLLAKGGKSVALTEIALKTTRNPLVAKVGGGQLKVAKAASVRLDRKGFGNELRATGLRLSPKVATRLNKRLSVDAFSKGQRLGTIHAAAEPKVLAVLPTGRMTIQFTPEFLDKLDSFSTSINSIFPAERNGPSVSFPIASEGSISPDARYGQVRVTGGLEFLRLGFGQVIWTDPWLGIHNTRDALLPAPDLGAELDLEPVPPFEGPAGRASVLNPILEAAQISTDSAARTVSVSGATLLLSDKTAFYFNRAFAGGAEAFRPGEPLGSLSFTAQTQ